MACSATFFTIMFKKKHKKPWSRRKKIIVFSALSPLFILAIVVLAVFFVFIYCAKDLPRPDKFTERTLVQSTKIFDRTGETLLYEIYNEEKRENVPLSYVPDNLRKALISVEDARFYHHFGLDLRAIMRSFLADIKLRRPAYGASTISQQLIRSTFLTNEKTLTRKIREVILTLELERRYSKDQILEWYINQIPMGRNIYGVQAASKTYFKKPVQNLSLNECAFLAALVQSPVYLSPYGNHLDELIARKDYVLNRMVQENYIKPEAAEAAKKEETKFSEIQQAILAPHFVFFVQDYLVEKYGQDYLEKGGLKVYTSLDWDMQKTAEKIVTDEVKKNRWSNAYNASLVAIDPKTGEILAMVGSADWFGESYPEGCSPGVNCLFDPQVNVATYNIGRQPGSSFKPFVYATAFEKGYDDKYVVVDEPTNFGIYGGKPYVPQNYDGLFRGPVTLRQALAQSLNIPAVKVLMYLAGIKDSVETAKKMGISTLKESSYYGPSITLGGGEVKLLDMVSAYSVFATEGLRYSASPILRIEDSDGRVIKNSDKNPKRILSSETCRLISDILSDNVSRAPMFGPNSQLYFPDYQVAVKTGTTTDYRDAWTIGYTPSIAVGVWAGNNDNTPIYKKSGSMIAAPMWHQFLENVLADRPKEFFTKP